MTPKVYTHIDKRYTILEQIGAGACAKVFHCHPLSSAQEERAVKVVDRKLAGEEAWYIANKEAEMLMGLSHPNIVKVIETDIQEDVLYIVMELVSGGDLFDHLHDVQYRETLVIQIIRKLLSALTYLHNRKIAHRDIKPENIMLRNPIPKNATQHQMECLLQDIALVDFGFAKYSPNNDSMREFCGTVEYMAPEVISCWRGRRNGYGFACDMWAVGVMTYRLLSGVLPFDGRDEDVIMKKVLRGSFTFYPEDVWNGVSQNAKDFISKLLVPDPILRITADQAITHSWILSSPCPSPALAPIPFTKDNKLSEPFDLINKISVVSHPED